VSDPDYDGLIEHLQFEMQQDMGDMPSEVPPKGKASPHTKWIKDDEGNDWPNPYYAGEEEAS
jgi:hypothetical protein